MIPKVIHYCWFGGAPLPAAARRCMESWRRFCPGYVIKEWNEGNCDLNACRYAREAYAQGQWAFVSDYIRFLVLYREGGIYLDTDVELIRPLDPIVEEGAFLGCEENVLEPDAPRMCAPGLGMGAEPGMEIYREILEHYEELGEFGEMTGIKDVSEACGIRGNCGNSEDNGNGSTSENGDNNGNGDNSGSGAEDCRDIQRVDESDTGREGTTVCRFVSRSLRCVNIARTGITAQVCRHPGIEAADVASAAIARHAPQTVVGHVTGILRAHGFEGNGGVEHVAGITIYPPEYFCPMDEQTGQLRITKHTCSIHWYTASWLPLRKRLRGRVRRMLYALGQGSAMERSSTFDGADNVGRGDSNIHYSSCI